jgi:hypothetical protein
VLSQGSCGYVLSISRTALSFSNIKKKGWLSKVALCKVHLCKQTNITVPTPHFYCGYPHNKNISRYTSPSPTGRQGRSKSMQNLSVCNCICQHVHFAIASVCIFLTAERYMPYLSIYIGIKKAFCTDSKLM